MYICVPIYWYRPAASEQLLFPWVSFFTMGIFILCLTVCFLFLATAVETRQMCYRTVINGVCYATAGSSLMTSQMQCCCSLGAAWGPSCVTCPQRNSGKYHAHSRKIYFLIFRRQNKILQWLICQELRVNVFYDNWSPKWVTAMEPR